MIEQIEKPNKVKIIQKLENDEELCDSAIREGFKKKKKSMEISILSLTPPP